jgi:hypothetical protein
MSKLNGLWVVALAIPIGAAAADDKKPFPEGSEKAVKAVQEALPNGMIDAVEQPKGFGADPEGKAPLFWNVRLHVGDDKKDLTVTPDGVIVVLPTTVEIKDLPEAVKDGLAKAAPDAKVLAVEKQEIRAAIRYAALDKPEATFTADVVKDDKKVRVRVAADGKILKKEPLDEEKKPAKGEGEAAAAKEDEKPAKADDKKKPKFPEEAAKAVKAVQDAFPDAEITGVENVGYLDGTGTMDILNYEVEFELKTVEHELNVTPEGVIIHLTLPVETKDLPKAVTEALAKEVPDGKVQNASKEETRAGLKFVALEKPRVIYVATVESKGVKSSIKLRPDGTAIKEVDPFGKKKDGE